MEVKKEYGDIKKKHKLPEFEQLDSDFEISSIEAEGFLLRSIRRKISDKIEKYIALLEGILQPEAVLRDMQECHVFSEREKNKIYEIYKRMMALDRQSYEIALDEKDEQTAGFISEAFSEWQELKKELKPVIIKLKDSWKKDTDINEVLNYMG